MKTRTIPLLALTLAALCQVAISKPVANYGKLALSFAPNRGQAPADVKFISRGMGYTLFLKSTAWELAPSLAPSQDVVRMSLVGANPTPTVSGADQLVGKHNYFLGNKPEAWLSDVPTYARVKYNEVYPSVDLVFYGNQKRLEFDFLVGPGADPTSIALQIEGATEVDLTSSLTA